MHESSIVIGNSPQSVMEVPTNLGHVIHDAHTAVSFWYQ